MAIAYNPTNGLSFENLSKKDSFGKDIIFDLLGKSVYAKGTLVGKVYQEFQKSTSSTTGLSGLVPFPDYNGNSKTRFLREDGTWVVPTNTNNYRPISINGTSILNNNNTALDLVAGNNITLNPEKDSNNKYTGKVTITASNPAWNNITGKPTTLAGYGITDAVKLASFGQNGIDLNELDETGIWNGLQPINRPTGAYGYSSILNSAYQPDYQTQLYFDHHLGNVLKRNNKAGTWQEWNMLLDTANASSHVVDLTSNQTISGEKTFSNLKVNNTNLVTNLNAEMVGGKPLDKLFAERGSIPLNNDDAYDYNKALIVGGYNTVSFADVDNIVNAPFSNYGTLLYVTGKGDTWMQLASEYNRTSLYVRSGNIRNSEVYTVTNWKKVAFTDSNITGNAATASALIRNTMPADANDLFDGRSPNQLLFFSEFSSATKNLPEEIGYDTALLHIGRYNSGTASQLYFGRSGNIHYRSSASGWKKIFFDNSNSLTPSGGTLTVDGNLITNKVASKSLVSFIGNDNTERIALQNNSSNDLLIGGGYTDKTVYLDANIFRSRANTTVLGGKVGIGTSSPTEKLQVNGNVKATSFLGNLDGSYINKLTGYTKATAISAIAATDTLNTALGKLEFKTDFIYNDLFGTDNDDIINKWHEIVDFVDSVAENTDITDEFVTRKTTQTITGAKTFSEKLIIESGHDAKLILNNTDTENKY